ncbi:DUF418 domain-containing protein [Mariniluteicoccus flavus]
MSSARSTADRATPSPSVSARIPALDIARGIAIFGTLATNIWLFSHPGGFLGYLGGPTTPGAGPAQQRVEAFLMALANGKFLGLLTLMFGIGLAIQARSAQRRGRPWPGRYWVRAGLLFAEGLVHYLLIAEFDVLMGYAVTALVVSWFILASPRVRLGVAVACTALHVAAVGVVTWLLVAMPTGAMALPGTGSDANPYRDGSWLDLVGLRLDQAFLFRLEPVFIGPMSVAMFLAGAALLSRGIFEPRGAGLRRRLMIAGGIALPLDLLLAQLPTSVLVCRYLLAPVVSAGLLALIAHAWLGREPGFVGRRLSEVGRAALSCYIAQNLLSSALFYGWGLGLNAVAPVLRLPVTAVAYAGVCLAIATLAHLWLRRFERGPVEGLVHRVSAKI